MCVIFLSSVLLILFYAVPLKKDLYVCIIHLALPQYWYPTPFPFEKMYIRLFPLTGTGI
jgi:hypothetical protein